MARFFLTRGFENQTRTYQEEFEGLGGKVPVSRDGQDVETDEVKINKTKKTCRSNISNASTFNLDSPASYVRLKEILYLKKPLSFFG